MDWDSAKKLRFKAFLLELLKDRQAAFNKKLLELVEDKASDSKSAMGDKYETSREIIGQELNRLDQQNNANNLQLADLSAIDFGVKERIVAGAVFSAGDKHFAWNTGLGKVVFEEQDVLCFSGQSPIAKTALNVAAGGEIGIPQNRMQVAWVI